MPVKYTPEQRVIAFWSKVTISDNPDGCWEWHFASRNKQGYGSFLFNGRRQGAHRVSWQLVNGEIPNDMDICHTCDNPCCVNPKHLFVGTTKDNMQDRECKQRGNQAKGESSGRHKLTSDQVLAIRAIYISGEIGYGTLAKQFGVKPGAIQAIIKRRSWSHI